MASGVPSRASNKVKQATRAASWKNGEERKKLRVARQAAAEVQNKKCRAQGILTPWERACARRAEVRLAAGCRARWEAAQRKKEQFPAATV